MKSKLTKLFTAASAIFAINGCDIIDSDNNQYTVTPSQVTAVVATVAADFSAGALSIITGENNRTALNELYPTNSDATINTFNNSVYMIGRKNNSIAKFDLNDHTQPIWQYSTEDTIDDPVGSNPYQIVFVNESKAYILRYGKSTAWIVDPSATTAETFKIGEIDLSAYSDADGKPEMSMAVIANGKLFIAMQRLTNYAPDNISYVAVFDTTTDLEIDTGYEGDTLKGIPLTIVNPTSSMQYVAANDSIYIQAIGSYGADFIGGIEKINATDYATTMVLDDGTATSHPDEKISSMAIVSPSLGYYVSYKGWGSTSLYQFNPSTGEDVLTSISQLASGDQADLAVDANGLLWVSDTSNATVHVVDPVTDTLLDSTATVLNPVKINFITQ